jgi:cell division septation protein DedD
MDAPFSTAGDRPFPSKSRRFLRKPVLFASAQVGENTTGLILNISEGGICVQTPQSIAGNGALPLRLQSLRSMGWIETHGRVVWSNDEKHVAGIEFIGITEDARREVQAWLSFGDSLQELRGTWAGDRAATGLRPPLGTDSTGAHTGQGVETEHVEPEYAEQEYGEQEYVPQEYTALPASDSGDDGGSARSEARTEQEPDNQTETRGHPDGVPDFFDRTRTGNKANRRTFPLLVSAAVLVIVLALAAARHDALSRVSGWFAKKAVAPGGEELLSQAQPKVTETPHAPATPLPVASPSPSGPAGNGQRTVVQKPSAPPISANGVKFALQVAAMREEENATQLEQSLQSKNFAAFVSKRPGDHFYRVMVGPYPDNQSARLAQSALEKDGMKSIARRWTP